ncbi:myristylated tegument protein [Common bottlenose dolphin gammaherpesvirus 1 strain Sarasota]|uniref:Myristylated tegument protein n=1 Tax=Common bottlenose dolphin gammaherpesvirus 1 strain Sarasota TaxID=2022783 RepID=A0A1Z1NE84_9GAMA|nr:myristylated tegument protein [Common bottlenose dolphin gammaherpesvirus 1 strain Sarasota]ARW78101.1 myristylated tegument protein [Common bottlenose dolphin gammaherpesvirus 1 strain Sarasota]
MGIIHSICKRRHNALKDILGLPIDIEEDFEKFEEFHLINNEVANETCQGDPPRESEDYSDDELDHENLLFKAEPSNLRKPHTRYKY